jgi:16S rRNA (guanine527-N7)-methyltransferase
VPEPAGPRARLLADAGRMGVTLSEQQCDALLEFADLLRRWNRAFNLISRRDIDRLLPRHLLDSLSVVPLLRGAGVMDLGTGAGLPGVPLAIACGGEQFTLVDRNERKIRFVDQAVRTLALENVSTYCGDVRDLPADARFGSVVSRAVADIPLLWQLSASRLAPGGCLVVMHRGQSLKAALRPQVAAPAGAEVVERRTVVIPGLEQPHELIVLAPAPGAASASARGGGAAE